MIFIGKISQKLFAAADHVQKSAAGAVVFFVCTEVLCEVIDALGENSNLNFGGSGIAFKTCEFSDDSGFDVFFHNKILSCREANLPPWETTATVVFINIHQLSKFSN